VAATETALADMMAADLAALDLVALMVDGVHFADHLCVVALGIGIDGTKHPLGLVEGDTENATVVKDLLAGRRVSAMTASVWCPRCSTTCCWGGSSLRLTTGASAGPTRVGDAYRARLGCDRGEKLEATTRCGGR